MANEKVTQQKLDDYLKELEKQLVQIPVADRSDIILELNGHIQDSLASGDKNIDEILKALGSPEQVANKYLLERGITPTPPRKTGWLKWGCLSIIGLFLFLVICLFLIIRSFFPILDVNEDKGSVRILGGLIDVNEQTGTVKLGKGLINVNGAEFDISDLAVGKLKVKGVPYKGSKDLTGVKNIVLEAANGKFEVLSHALKTIDYDCTLYSADEENKDYTDLKEDTFSLDFDHVGGVDCDILIPENIDTKIDFGNGKLALERLKQNVNAEITNGKISFKRDFNAKYKIEANVTNGTVKGGPLDDVGEAQIPYYKIKLSATNGKISVK